MPESLIDMFEGQGKVFNDVFATDVRFKVSRLSGICRVEHFDWHG